MNVGRALTRLVDGSRSALIHSGAILARMRVLGSCIAAYGITVLDRLSHAVRALRGGGTSPVVILERPACSLDQTPRSKADRAQASLATRLERLFLY